MFNLGSASGMLSLSSKFDTRAGQNSLKHFQDAKSKLDKLSEATIGTFNKKNTTEAPLAKTEAATDASAAAAKVSEGAATAADQADAEGATSVLDSVKNSISDAVESTKSAVSDAYDSTKSALSDAADYVSEKTSSAFDAVSEAFSNGTVTDDEFTEFAAAADAAGTQKSWLDYVGDAIDTVTETTSGILDDFTTNFCSTAPFAACGSCPNRPKRGNLGEGFNLLKEIKGLIDDLKAGFEDAALAIIGCPGMTNAILEGDFDGLTDAVIAGGTKALVSTAIDTGSAAFMGALNAVSPDAANMVENVASKIFSNAGANSFDSVCIVFDNLNTTGDQVLKSWSYAKNGEFTKAFGALSSRKARNTGLHAGESGILVARGYSSRSSRSTFTNANVTTASLSKLFTSNSADLSESVSCKKMRTRAKFSSAKVSTLPGTTLGTDTIKTGYAVDYLKTGTSTPKDTKVKTYKTRSNCLY